MNTEEATDFVVKSLGRHQSPKMISEILCEKAGMNWQEAKAFVERVRVEKSDVIAVKQSPLFLFLGGGAILVGLIILVLTIFPYFLPSTSSSAFHPRDFRSIILGTLLILGGLRGIWSTVVRLWNS